MSVVCCDLELGVDAEILGLQKTHQDVSGCLQKLVFHHHIREVGEHEVPGSLQQLNQVMCFGKSAVISVCLPDELKGNSTDIHNLG